MSQWISRPACWVAGRPLPRGPAIVATTIVAAAVVILVWASFIRPVSGNPASRLASIEALVDYGDWSIDESIYRYQTVDKVRLDGRYYSSKPPVYAGLGSVAYSTFRRLSGPAFAEDEGQAGVRWLRLWLHVLPFLIGLVVAGRWLRGRVKGDWIWVGGLLAFALGTFVFGYSATINNHAPAALLMLAATAGATRLRRNLANESTVPGFETHRDAAVFARSDAGKQPTSTPSNREGDGPTETQRTGLVAFGIGFCSALAVTLDFGAGVFAIGITVYLAASPARRSLPWLVLGAALPLAVHAHLTWRLLDTLAPAYFRPEIYDYPGSYWLAPADFDALDEPRWVYAIHALIGHHGLFSMTPVFVLAIPGVVGMVRRRHQRADGLLFGLVPLLTIVIYLVRGPFNYGGTANGMRWFIVLVPLLWMAAVETVDRHRQRRWLKVLFAVLVSIGMIHAMAAVWLGPWEVSPWNLLLRDIGLGSVAG